MAKTVGYMWPFLTIPCWWKRFGPWKAACGILRESTGVSRLYKGWWSYHNQAVSAIKFLYEHVLKVPREVADVPRPRKERKLPAVLSREAVMRLLEAVGNLKHRALLMLVYSAGLRVSEVVRLQKEDIDEERRLIRVRGGKGRKELGRIRSPLDMLGLEEKIDTSVREAKKPSSRVGNKRSTAQ